MPSQLVDQNSALKKEAGIAERKLLARNERIQNLETLLQDADRRLAVQNQKFETQLQSVKERLEQARGKLDNDVFALTGLTPVCSAKDFKWPELWAHRQATAWRWGICGSYRRHYCYPCIDCRRCHISKPHGSHPE